MSDMQSQLLSKRMVVPLFMFFGFAGGVVLVIASLFIPGVIGHGSWIRLLVGTLLGMTLIAIGIRPRAVRWFPLTRVVKLGWGVRWMWVFKTIQSQDWISLSIQQVFPVVVTPIGSVMHTSTLPPYWKLLGMTKELNSIFLAQYPTEAAAQAGRKTFAGYFNLQTKLFLTEVRLSDDWKAAEFFQERKKHAVLYAALCQSGNWKCYTASSNYDADVPNLLEETYFDIPLLASQANVTKPWQKLLDLEQAGWIKPLHGDKGLQRLAELEKKLSWVTPEILSITT